MRRIMIGWAVWAITLSAFAGEAVQYEMNGEAFEGYIEKGRADAPMVLLVHDWDGLTDYEVKRAGMLAEMGYAVFCADLFGAGVRPTELADKQKCTGELDADASAELARQVTGFIQELREVELYKIPGVAETLDWTAALVALDQQALTLDVVHDTLGVILKYQDDIERVDGERARQILDRVRVAS